LLEPPLTTANIVLPILSLDYYDMDKVASYVSFDGVPILTLKALSKIRKWGILSLTKLFFAMSYLLIPPTNILKKYSNT